MVYHTWKICGAACLLLMAARTAVSAQETTPGTGFEQERMESDTVAGTAEEDDLSEGEESWYSFYDELFEEDDTGVTEDTDAAVPDIYTPDSETPDAGITDIFAPDTETPDAAAETFAVTESAAAPNDYLPVEFVDDISTLTWFPKDATVEEAVQGGQRMIKLCPKDISEKGSLGVRYGKIAQKGDTWYDLKITVTDFETEHRITKEGEIDVYPTVAFCKTQIAWGRPEATGKITLKMEFVESGTDNVLPFGGGMQWTITDALAPVAQGSVSVLQGIRQGALQQTEKTLQTVRREPQVRLFVAEYKRAVRQWTQNTVFQVYEWNGHEYAAYRGSLAYDGERRLYVMEHLVRSSLNQGRYKVVQEAGGWEQEFLVPDLPVVTDLYYHIET